MADSKIGIALILSAYDKASATINTFTNNSIKRMAEIEKKSAALANKSFSTGKELVAAGAAVAVPVYKTITAYSDLEDAQLRLQASMMDGSGKITAQWDKINALAIQLGNELPGTTQDFYNMFDVMIRNGARAEDIVSGTGRAAAYLAIATKQPYDQMGELAQRLQVATGVANKDLLQFYDLLSRINVEGANTDEMQYAFQRSAGELKAMKIQGLEAMKQLAPVYDILIKTMGSGERVGTNFAALLQSMGDASTMKNVNVIAKALHIEPLKFTDNKGDFLGVENMVEQLDKLHNLPTKYKNLFIEQLAGAKGMDSQILSTLIDSGKAGYEEKIAAIKRHAELMARVNHILQSFKNKFESVAGTLVNTAANIGSKVGPQFKSLFERINNFLPKVDAFVNKHPRMVGWILKGALAFSAMSLAGGALAFTFGGIFRGISTISAVMKGGIKIFQLLRFGIFALRYGFMINLLPAIKVAATAFRAFGLALLTNPLTLYVAAAVALGAAVYFIVKNWSGIGKFFSNLWGKVKEGFVKGIHAIKYLLLGPFLPTVLIFKHWDKIGPYFYKTWDKVKGIFKSVVKWFVTLHVKFFEAGANLVKSIWQGIKSMAHKPVEAIKNMVGKIRKFLPFSPAKEGPLMDLHKIKLVETIAASIRPDALINAWRKTLSGFYHTVRQPSPVPAMAGSGGIVNNFSFNITVNGGASDSDARVILETIKKNFPKFIDDYMRNKNRVGFV